MKKVFLKCCLIKNLGDDLFVKIITDRYKNNFYTLVNQKYSKKIFSPNFKMYYVNDFIYRCIRKLCNTLGVNDMIEKRIVDKADCIVTIGGSVFMQDKNQMKYRHGTWYQKYPKEQYIIGSNIGPYYDEDFVKDLKENVFSVAQDVSLRDEKSYALVKELENTRCNPDLVFSLDTSKYIKEDNEIVVITVINPQKKKSQIKEVDEKAYEEKILEMANYFSEQGYEVVLMSFCKKEGDEAFINKIMDRVQNKNVKRHFYRGDIYKAVSMIAKSKIVVGSRFHANILGLLFGKTIIPISYNDKTINFLEDIEFKGKIAKIEEIQDFDIESFTKEDLEYKIDVTELSEKALKHFEKLDEILEKR